MDVGKVGREGATKTKQGGELQGRKKVQKQRQEEIQPSSIETAKN